MRAILSCCGMLTCLFSNAQGAESNIVLISGGPCVFDAKDPEQHDKSWANFVTPPGLLLSSGGLAPRQSQEVWWFIYRPAYEARWADDIRATDHRKESVKQVQNANAKSYVAFLEEKAKSRKWKLKWIGSEKDLWAGLATFRQPIDKVYYWGHAKDDLWLYCRHDTSHRAIAPPDDARVKVASIDANATLAKLLAGGEKKATELWGCNTAKWARRWTDVMKVESIGFSDTVDFASIHTTGGLPSFKEKDKQVYKP